MITIRFYNSERKNAKDLRTFQFHFNEYNTLNYLYPVLSYLVQFKPKYYTIQLCKGHRVNGNVRTYYFYSGGYRQYIKLDDINSFIDTLIAYAFEAMSQATSDLAGARNNSIIRQLINEYYPIQSQQKRI